MKITLNDYAEITGYDVIDQLYQLSKSLKGKKVVHVNSTRSGGGVAEILHKLVPLMNDLGIDTSWEIISGDASFYQCTKSFHNALQGNSVDISESLLKFYEETNHKNVEKYRYLLKKCGCSVHSRSTTGALLTVLSGKKRQMDLALSYRCQPSL